MNTDFELLFTKLLSKYYNSKYLISSINETHKVWQPSNQVDCVSYSCFLVLLEVKHNKSYKPHEKAIRKKNFARKHAEIRKHSSNQEPNIRHGTQPLF